MLEQLPFKQGLGRLLVFSNFTQRGPVPILFNLCLLLSLRAWLGIGLKSCLLSNLKARSFATGKFSRRLLRVSPFYKTPKVLEVRSKGYV